MSEESRNAVSQTFQARILNDLLPLFCNDPSRSLGPKGFKAEWNKIAEIDAADFLRGMDAELVRHKGRGLYRAPRSLASEQFFWSGARSKKPRPITLWAEPIITVAVLTRLHFELDYPKELLGTQSKGWAFDVVAYRSPPDSDLEHIVCEVKKSVSEIERLIERMKRFGMNPRINRAEVTLKEQNAFRKVCALRSRRPPLFFAAGPAKSGQAFDVKYRDTGEVSFDNVAVEKMTFAPQRKS